MKGGGGVGEKEERGVGEGFLSVFTYVYDFYEALSTAAAGVIP